MKLSYLGTVYRVYADAFAARPRDSSASFDEVRAELERDAYGWVGAWGPALAPLGWSVGETWLNVERLQRAWARERDRPSTLALEEMALEQVASFAPDVLWYDHHDLALLAAIRERCPSIRAVVGWAGTIVPPTVTARCFDLVLSCAPETVESLRHGGARAEVLLHAFNDRVLAQLGPRAPSIDVSFIGQIAADHPLHGDRERLLESLLEERAIEIFSPTDAARSGAATKRAAYAAVSSLRRAGLGDEALRRLPVVGRAADWTAPPRGPLPGRLRRALRPGRFGLEMYRTLRDSKVTLNLHGGSERRYTSNMRLFEATGAGACLLTDAASNLAELFEPEREVLTFRSIDECRERIRHVLEHDDEREAIAAAGQARCLAQHTFHHRAPRLDEIFRGLLARF